MFDRRFIKTYAYCHIIYKCFALDDYQVVLTLIWSGMAEHSQSIDKHSAMYHDIPNFYFVFCQPLHAL